MNKAPQTLKGFRDFLPEEKRKRDWVQKKIVEVFERFGFEPLETPTLEYANLLLGKYGQEADKLVYTFKDRGDREVGLRYDQTVPTARVLSQYQNELPKFFRRYQIQNNFRAEKPQAGRFREFTQCDIDIFGTTNPLSDAEIITCTVNAFKNIGFPKIKILINDRQVLFEILKPFTTDQVDIFSIIQSVDKLDKQTPEQVTQELISKGLTSPNASQALDSIKSTSPSDNLKTIFDYLSSLGIDPENYIFSPTTARGLDYYTSTIFEVQLPIEGLDIGSFGGGGRYDNLIKQIGGPDTPAVGISFGLDRTVEAANLLSLVPSQNSTAQVLVTIFETQFLNQSLQAATQLRQAGINTEVYPDSTKLGKQFKLANLKNIPFVIVIGQEEANSNQVTLKNMATGDQQTLPLDAAITQLKSST